MPDRASTRIRSGDHAARRDERVEDQGVADLRTLASGFRDLSKAAAVPPRPAVDPPPATVPAASPAPGTPAPPPANRVYTAADAQVKRPTVISQPLPAWRPDNPVEERQSYHGSVELVISEEGQVLSAVLLESVHTRYDPLLLKAAQEWKFRPATRDGKPVRYRLRPQHSPRTVERFWGQTGVRRGSDRGLTPV